MGQPLGFSLLLPAVTVGDHFSLEAPGGSLSVHTDCRDLSGRRGLVRQRQEGARIFQNWSADL